MNKLSSAVNVRSFADINPLEETSEQVRSTNIEKNPNPKEEWEIELDILEMRNVIAPGAYGIVYKGIYAGQDVAVKVLDWGEDGYATTAESSALRASFRQELRFGTNLTTLTSQSCWIIDGNNESKDT